MGLERSVQSAARASVTKHCKNRLQQAVGTAKKILGANLPFIQDLCTSHPELHLFQVLHSAGHDRKTTRHRFCHKRHQLDGYEQQPPTKKCLDSVATVLGRPHNAATQHTWLERSCGHACTRGAFPNGETRHPNDFTSLCVQTSSWADTQRAVKKVLEHLKLNAGPDDFLLSDSANDKFLGFHRDISDECGEDDRQHSWAVIEKPEEVIMYGPYYPNYNSGEHSEDVIIRQTQELLEAGGAGGVCKVYVFTMNSPCLARNTHPCMLNLVHKAHEWWRVFGATTHIGYARSWGFKGSKETLFRDVNYTQLLCISKSLDYESYVKAAEESTDFNTLCETVFCAAKRLLRQGDVPFSVQKQDWKSHFKRVHTAFESRPEDEKEALTQEVSAAIEAAEVLLSGKPENYEEHLESGRAFARTLGSRACDGDQDQIRLTFQQCWTEMVQDKYAEFVREKLNEDFNQCTVRLFISDIHEFTEEYLQIGKVQFPEKDEKTQ
ncbi:uncharacterized protein LOC124999458 [Mugil cephalus]|uniref:uncharacterized protein LOC124999458 n=1 Tax=Mugil cephalus TaxID=48193 RepID=UPI001FB6B604|nr:uncharacterized protein LOC124999458 [Mugil cephalus]